MGRLFWKIFFAFVVTMLVMGFGVGFVVHIHGQQRLAQMTELAAGPRAERNLAAAATALRYGGAAGLAALAEQWPARRPLPVLAVDDHGVDLLGRPVPPIALERARALSEARGDSDGDVVRAVQAPDGRRYLLFAPTDVLPHRFRGTHRFSGPDPFYLRLAITLLAGILFSGGLAWYLTRPLRHLRRATARLADGALDTRVMPALGPRRDELGDLGRDFDHMAERLQALVGAQKRLLNDVSHELRSPLARLQVAVGLARQQPDKLVSALERIERESGRLDDLVGQLLTLSRLEAGVVQGPEEYLDVSELLEDIVDDARFEAAASGREVRLHSDGELLLKGRAELLRRAFENVIRNGVRHTAPGTAVEVTLERAPVGNRMIASVCDQGPGVPETELATLFEPFVRSAQGETGGGYGLGLAITRRAVEAHGGTVAARNRAGGGLCVTLQLPLATDIAAGDAAEREGGK